MTFSKPSEQQIPPEDIEKYKSEAMQLRDAKPEELTEESLKKFSIEDKQNLFEAFRAIDADQNWALSVDELQVFMNECNLDSSFTNLIMRIIHPVKPEDIKTDNGLVSFKEFLHFIYLLQEVQKNTNYLFETLFNAIDANGNKELESNEIIEFINYFTDDKNSIQPDDVDKFLDGFGKKSLTIEDLKSILE